MFAPAMKYEQISERLALDKSKFFHVGKILVGVSLLKALYLGHLEANFAKT